MQGLKKQIYLLAAIGLFGISSSAMASVIGSLNVANCSGGGVTVSATTIVWSPPTLGGTAGCINTGIGTSLTYSGGTLLPGATGNILDLTAGGGAVNNFMTFLGTTLDFVLTGLGPGSANTTCSGLAVGASCSVAASSPFILTNVGNGNTAGSLSALGTIVDGGVTSVWSGAFTTQVNQTAAAIQTTELAGGSISSTQSGQFTVTAVPEPGTVSILMLGSAVLLGFSRLRFGKS
jgi:hypothetical protein